MQHSLDESRTKLYHKSDTRGKETPYKLEKPVSAKSRLSVKTLDIPVIMKETSSSISNSQQSNHSKQKTSNEYIDYSPSQEVRNKQSNQI